MEAFSISSSIPNHLGGYPVNGFESPGKKKTLSLKQQQVLSQFGESFCKDEFHVGKYRGRKFIQVITEDPTYIRYLLTLTKVGSMTDDVNNLEEWIENYSPPKTN